MLSPAYPLELSVGLGSSPLLRGIGALSGTLVGRGFKADGLESRLVPGERWKWHGGSLKASVCIHSFPSGVFH